MKEKHSGGLRILLTGRDGQVGRELSRSLTKLGEVTATGRDELDLTSDYAIGDVVHEVRPQLIVNAAAYTAVDKAESEPDFAHRINAEAVATLAAAAKAVGAAVIHYSTDYVFDGSKETPYVESDRAHPLSVYGKSKLDGEKALAAAGIPYLILRTSWVYGGEGKNFLLSILRLAMERSELRVVKDQIGAPTWSRDIANATASIADKWHHDKFAAGKSGVYHMTAAGKTSWFGFAEEAVRLRAMSAAGKGTKFAQLVPIASSDYPTPAERPKNSELDCAKLAREFDCSLPEWKASVAAVMRALK
jgi:dTDP-4-dehydrorhamnose reductase